MVWIVFVWFITPYSLVGGCFAVNRTLVTSLSSLLKHQISDGPINPGHTQIIWIDEDQEYLLRTQHILVQGAPGLTSGLFGWLRRVPAVRLAYFELWRPTSKVLVAVTSARETLPRLEERSRVDRDHMIPSKQLQTQSYSGLTYFVC
jgi:hypothetical protein